MGKDTFQQMCADYYKETYKISTIDKIKEALTILDVNVNDKTELTRKLMSDFKAMMVCFNEYPKNYVINWKTKLDSMNKEYLLFVDSREPDEIQWFVNNIQAKTLLIINNNIPKIISNQSDKNVEKFNYDYIITNNETLKKLRQKAIYFLLELFPNTILK